MELTLVAVVILLWLAASGRLAKAFSVLTNPAPTNTSSQTPSNVSKNVGWAPLDNQVFAPPLHQTFSNVRGEPVKQVPQGLTVIGRGGDGGGA